jgi:hypothetical protein
MNSYMPLCVSDLSSQTSKTRAFREEGDSVVGTVVQIYCPGGVSVDVGCCDTLAFLEVEAGTRTPWQVVGDNKGMVYHMGISTNGDTPIAGCFFDGKSQTRMDDN